MGGWLNDISFWHWLALGLALVALEVVVPGTVLLWLGISAAVTGIVKLILPAMGWEFQLLIFAVFSVLTVTLSLIFIRPRMVQGDDSALNMRGKQMIGLVTTLDEPIVNGRGRARFGDTVWTVEGEDYIRGTKVRVTDVHGNVLKVERI